jgi:hypothetical protein
MATPQNSATKSSENAARHFFAANQHRTQRMAVLTRFNTL